MGRPSPCPKVRFPLLLGIGPAMVGEVGKKQPDYWPKAKALLQNPSGLLDSLIKFDRDNIPEKTIQKIEPLIKSEDFAQDPTAGDCCCCPAQRIGVSIGFSGSAFTNLCQRNPVIDGTMTSIMIVIVL